MNSVHIIGRLTKDPQISYISGTQTAVARFSVAISRGKDKDGNDKGADFPNIVVFGRQAENCERYLSKGKLVGIEGRLQTGSYEKDGRTVYTTDVIASRVEFLEWDNKEKSEIPSGFRAIEDDIPF